MAENFRAWFLRTRGVEYPGFGPGNIIPRALDAMADWAEVVAQRATATPEQAPVPPPEVQVCRVENHIIPGRAADLRVIADDPDAEGDQALRRWVQDRLNGPSPTAPVGEKKPEPANTRMFVIACRHNAFYVVGPFSDRFQLDNWAEHERENGDDPRWQRVDLPSSHQWPDSQFPIPVYLSASKHPPRD